MADFVKLSFDLAFKYRNPVMILSDGVIGQMMEKVYLDKPIPRWTLEEIKEIAPWSTIGKPTTRERNIITSLDLDPARHERHNQKLQKKYRKIEEEEVRYEMIDCDDPEILIVAYGSSARIAQKSLLLAREKGLKVGLLRPITLYPFPAKQIRQLANQVKGILSLELSAGQLIEDVRLAVEGKVKVIHYGRMGGMIYTPDEVLWIIEQKLLGD
jgi:2-oxoglutarate ferredoxin oxidoreductase subunit alpha